MKKSTIILAFAALFLTACNNNNNNSNNMKTDNNTIFPKGEKVSANFTGTAWLQMLTTDVENFDTQTYNVTFEPGCRNYWHSHPGGQILLVTSGKGFYQERGKPAQLLKAGDTVEIRPNVVHWHGATAESEFVHIGITAQVSKGPAVWHGEVTDEEYKQANEQ